MKTILKLIFYTRMLYALIVLFILAQCACSVQAQLPTRPTAPVPHVTAIIPTGMETRHYVTTAPLHLRSCAGLCEPPLAYLPQGTEIEVEVTGIIGSGCAGAEWWSIKAGKFAGFVCSIYVMEAK